MRRADLAHGMRGGGRASGERRRRRPHSAAAGARQALHPRSPRARPPIHPPATMAVLLETSRGDLVIDLATDAAPSACRNFVKLCK